jgi:hypothetical protein
MKYILFVTALLLTIGCKKGNQKLERNTDKNTISASDTTVISRSVPSDSPNSTRKRATIYSVVIGGDTTDFQPLVAELKLRDEVLISMNPQQSTAAYSKQYEFLQLILPVAASAYDFESLAGVGFGRLIESGDLAVEVTREYIDTYGQPKQITVKDYQRISDFLLDSKLASDFNTLLKPYSLVVDNIRIEKVLFASPDSLSYDVEFGTRPADMPEKVLDVIVSVELRKE